MRRYLHRLAAVAAAMAGLAITMAAEAQEAPAAAPAPEAAFTAGAYKVKLSNTEKQAITAIYASPPGKNEWGDDLLGRQTAAAGRAVTLDFKAATPDACVLDLQMLMNDGKLVEKRRVNVCQSADYQFKR